MLWGLKMSVVGGRGTVQELLAVETQITIKLGQRVGGQRKAEDITKVVEAPDVFLQSAHCALPFVFFYYLSWLTSWVTFISLSPPTDLDCSEQYGPGQRDRQGVILLPRRNRGKGEKTGLFGRRLFLEMGGRGAHIQTGRSYIG